MEEGVDEGETMGKMRVDVNDKKEVVWYEEWMVRWMNEVRKERVVRGVESVKELYRQKMVSENRRVKKVEVG